jgi:glycosyltransferase involved in cell wall biosynthesis
MKFSLLIAHFCNYDFFVECYDSIKIQTYQNFEIIIVDDCSTDDSVKKIKKLTESDSRVKIFENEKNMGVGFTKRKCIDLATGEICAFIDPDDTIAENALEESLNGYSNPKIIATHSQIKVCDHNLKFIKLLPNIGAVKPNNKLFFNIQFKLNHFFTFKKAAYLKTSGINENISSSVDQDLYLKLYDIGQIKYIPQPLYHYRLHDNGVSQNKNKKGKLKENWHIVLKDTLIRREMNVLYGKKVTEIDNLPEYIFNKQNTILSRIIRKLS